MTTAINQYATKESVVSAIRWSGSDSCRKQIESWIGASTLCSTSDNVLIYQFDEGMTQQLPLGNYLVQVGKYFHSFTPEEMEDVYTKVG